MINDKLFNPQSIVVVGASNNVAKPGGKIVKNLVDSNFKGNLLLVNPKQNEVQGLKAYQDVKELNSVDLAILAIPAPFCYDTIKVLAEEKQTKAFIIVSAGFGETNEQGKQLEKQIVELVNRHDACLIGPNCIGMITPNYAGVFTTPIPAMTNAGVDFISGSGATAVFIIESGMSKGLQFANIFSVGNSAQIGVEDILAYLDENYVDGVSPKVKLLYIENIDNPDILLKHATSLIKKGCKIAAIKAGSSSAGSRAASSHTGALTSSDVAVDALFKKAGIVRCYGREELTTVANIFMGKQLKGDKIAIITHAGGPGVMLADALEEGGLKIPEIKDSLAKEALKEKLFAGSSVENPIDFLATGTAEQLGHIIDACENDFDVDGMAVIFGSPGLFKVGDVYDVLHEKMQYCSKPIYPILPSVINVKEDIAAFVAKRNMTFPDEVVFAKALTKVYNTPQPLLMIEPAQPETKNKIRAIIEQAKNGYQRPEVIHQLFDSVGIPRVKEKVVERVDDAVSGAKEIGFPIVMKVIGPVHKSDVGGVVLNVTSAEQVKKEFNRLMEIEDAEAVLLAQMASGTEIFLGASYEEGFGHIVVCGMGGIYVEVLKDVTYGLTPITHAEAEAMVKSLKSYKILEGVRNQKGINLSTFYGAIVKLSNLLCYAPEIKELDINPMLANENNIVAVDARIKIEK